MRAQATLVQRAVGLRPDAAICRNNLGQVLDRLARYDEAARCYEAAIELDSRYAVSGPAIFRPNDWTAMNDGKRRTYVIPPKGIGFLPVPAVIGASAAHNTPMTAASRVPGALRLSFVVTRPW